MNIVVSELDGMAAAAQPVEIVERKGLGHPDTLCDALAEQVSLRELLLARNIATD